MPLEGGAVPADRVTYRIVGSPIGEFVAGVTSRGCCLFEFRDRGGVERIGMRIEKRYHMEMVEGDSPLLSTVIEQAGEYFAGRRTAFDLPLDLAGTVFEKQVWEELLRIPYGETRSYGELAGVLGKPGASRAVGRANGANCIAVIVPCHRVIEADGNLRGYGGGLWRKRFLLDLEQAPYGDRHAGQTELFAS
jgi:AraC family transcriptional regulator of adaptative response/methylated-DNA-[protein]-cysteine methyltransferase